VLERQDEPIIIYTLESLIDSTREKGALNYGRFAFVLLGPRFIILMLNELFMTLHAVTYWQFYFLFGLYLDIVILILGILGSKFKIQKLSAILGIIVMSVLALISFIMNIIFLKNYINLILSF
jgi:hypothetical protein